VRAQCPADVPTGTQSYFVLGHDEHVNDMMNAVRLSEGGTGFGTAANNSIVSAVASADNQVIFYDQWEDGFDADLQGPGAPQATSLILGDGDPANGRACDWTQDPRVLGGNGVCDSVAAEDVLFRGTAVTLNSDQGTGACGIGTPALPNVRCSVPLPRGTAPLAASAHRFDGGDLLVTSGGPLSIVHSQDPLYAYVGGATEMLSQQATANATAFTVPIGENLYSRYDAVPPINGDDTP
jgi:hypothetical protein